MKFFPIFYTLACILNILTPELCHAVETTNRWQYIGTLDSKYRVYTDISLYGSDLTGYYHYYSVGIPIDLNGTLGQNSAFTLNESVGGKISGTFKGAFSKSFKSMQGIWFSPDNTKQMSFSLNIVAKSITSKSKIHDITIVYPHFFLDNAALNSDLNATMDEFASHELESFSEEIEEFAEEYGEEWSMYTDYTIEYVSGSLISILLSRYEYTGGAHPNSYVSALNYKTTSTGFVNFDLRDLFEKGFNYIDVLSDLCIADLKKQGASFVVEGSVDAISEDLFTFSITPKALQFHFAPYIVGCYAEGMYTVSLPYAQIQHIVDTEGVLKEFY
jgi:hypothetical protein